MEKFEQAQIVAEDAEKFFNGKLSRTEVMLRKSDSEDFKRYNEALSFALCCYTPCELERVVIWARRVLDFSSVLYSVLWRYEEVLERA